MQFSWIFTYRKAAQDREDLLFLTLQWLNELDFDFEVIIVEQDQSQKLEINQNYKFPINHIFVFNPSLFNRSWGFNVGIKAAQSEILFFADSDMIIHPKAIELSLEKLQNFDAINPFNVLMDLDQKKTQELLKEQKWVYNWTGSRRWGAGFCAGIVGYKKSAIEKIYGWDERFQGWGGEDDIQWFKTCRKLKTTDLNYPCFHLHHQRTSNNGSNKHANYQQNLRLFFKYKRAPFLLDHEGAQLNWGDKNKFHK